MSIRETTLRKYCVQGGLYDGHVAVTYAVAEMESNPSGAKHKRDLGFHSKIMGRILSEDGIVIDRSFPRSWVPELEGVPFYNNESVAAKALDDCVREASGRLVPLLMSEGI
tara:strand:- start:2194 stop:2526 length:333 start_codon:yes stop_codon:yes gene_type:complete